MKIIREKTILQKIDEEIDKKGLPDIIRIDLDEGEFTDFLRCLSKGVIATSFDSILTGIKNEYKNKISRSCVNNSKGRFKGSYVVYRNISVQCCYEEE